VVNGEAGADRLFGQGGADILGGGDGGDRLFGQGGSDTVSGGAGGDRVVGGTGRDVLAGGEGRDLLNGGKGGDTLSGGAGRDTMIGGQGADTFVFFAKEKGDLIRDFQPKEDRLSFEEMRGFQFGDAKISPMGQDGAKVAWNGIVVRLEDVRPEELENVRLFTDFDAV